MNFAAMKKLMGEGATDIQIQAALDAFNEEAKKLVDAETSGLKTNKTKLLDQMDKLKKNQIPDGFDKDGYAVYLTEKEDFAKKQKELADAELEGKGQWEALKIQLNTAHKTALDKVTSDSATEITGLRKALDRELIENKLIKAVEFEKGNSLFLLPHMKGQVITVRGEDGSYSEQVVDKKGNPRFQDDATTPFAVKDLVAEFKADPQFAPAFPDMNNGSGGDVNTGGKGGSNVNPWKAETKNITEQARVTRENPALAAQFKKAAGVA